MSSSFTFPHHIYEELLIAARVHRSDLYQMMVLELTKDIKYVFSMHYTQKAEVDNERANARRYG